MAGQMTSASGTHGSRAALRIAVIISIYVFMFFPIVIVIATAFGEASLIEFPPSGFTLKWFSALGEPRWYNPFLTSLVLAVGSTLLSAIIGVPAAWALSRYDFRGREILKQLFLAPLFVPWIITGVALLVAFNRAQMTGTFVAIFLGHIVVTIPYLVRSSLAGIEGLDKRLEDAAVSLGATRFQVFRCVVVPAIRPSIIAGAIFGFLMSFDNVAVSIFLTNPTLTTVPIEMLNFVQWVMDPTISAVSTVYLLVALLALLVADRWVGLRQFAGLR
jgi:putative spermidine/putrescine transport system permease protein